MARNRSKGEHHSTTDTPEERIEATRPEAPPGSKSVEVNGKLYRKPLPEDDEDPCNGGKFTNTEDGRGPNWPFPSTSLRCNAPSRQRTKAARAAKLIGPDEHRRCRRPCTAGQTKCRWHGGKMKNGWHGGIAKSGRYSKKLGNLREAYEQALADGSTFDLAEPIAVLDAVVQRMMDRLQDLDTPYFRQESRRLFAAVRTAASSGDPAAAREAMDALGALLDRGADEDKALDQLTSTVQLFQKRVEEAWRIKLSRDETMNVRDLVSVLGRVADIVFSECGDIINEDGDRVGDKIGYRLDDYLANLGTQGPARTSNQQAKAEALDAPNTNPTPATSTQPEE